MLFNGHSYFGVGKSDSITFSSENKFSIPKIIAQSNPIIINGNSDFRNQALLNGWTGSGDINNPIIISNQTIETNNNFSIFISNTNLYFIIENCVLTEHGIPEQLSTPAFPYYTPSAGILLNEVLNGELIGNVIQNNYGIGIWIKNSNYINLLYNIVQSNGDKGIFLFNSSNNYLFNNSAISNTNANILINSNSNNNILINNLAQNSINGNGIVVMQSNNNLLFHNEAINNNGWGVQVYHYDFDPQNNNVSFNNFINNNQYLNYTHQGWCDGSTNTYSHNYWSDLTGPDANHDGIVDISYNMSGLGPTDDEPEVQPFNLHFYTLQVPLEASYITKYITYSSSTNTQLSDIQLNWIIIGIVFFAVLSILVTFGIKKKSLKEVKYTNIENNNRNLEHKLSNNSKNFSKVLQICPKCHFKIEDSTDIFCQNCGSMLKRS